MVLEGHVNVSHLKPKRPQYRFIYCKIMSINIIMFCYMGCKKSFAVRNEPVGHSLAMSDICRRAGVGNSFGSAGHISDK
jgi:hypothetical protein